MQPEQLAVTVTDEDIEREIARPRGEYRPENTWCMGGMLAQSQCEQVTVLGESKSKPFADDMNPYKKDTVDEEEYSY